MSRSIYCPYCHRFTHLEVKSSFGNMHGDWDTAECNACHKVVLMNRNTQVIYPNPLPREVDAKIKESIKKDFEEALQCFSVNAYRAVAIMARRALQSVCLDKGAEEDDNLNKQIDWLHEQRVITSDLQLWAHEVRFVGNSAAHPRKPNEDTPVSKEDADDILKLLEQFCQVLYVAPAIANERRKLRESKESSKT